MVVVPVEMSVESSDPVQTEGDPSSMGTRLVEVEEAEAEKSGRSAKTVDELEALASENLGLWRRSCWPGTTLRVSQSTRRRVGADEARGSDEGAEGLGARERK